MISLAEKNTTFDTFKASLVKNGAEFTVCVCGDPCFVLISLLDLNFDNTCQSNKPLMCDVFMPLSSDDVTKLPVTSF